MRVRYRGRGRARASAGSVRLGAVAHVTLATRWAYRPWYVATLVGIFLLGFAGSMMIGHEGPFIVGSFTAFVLLPGLLVTRGRYLRLSTAGDALQVRVPRALVTEAHRFMNEIEAARHSLEGASPAPASMRVVPTATPFLR